MESFEPQHDAGAKRARSEVVSQDGVRYENWEYLRVRATQRLGWA